MSAAGLFAGVSGPPGWSLPVDSPGAWLNSNDRGAWTGTHRLVRQWRFSAAWAARRARVPRIDVAYILAELRFADRRRRDPLNWAPTVKACVDGLVDAYVLEDDNADRVVGPDLRRGPRDERCRVLLHIWAVGGG